MDRRDFLKIGGLGIIGLCIPSYVFSMLKSEEISPFLELPKLLRLLAITNKYSMTNDNDQEARFVFQKDENTFYGVTAMLNPLDEQKGGSFYNKYRMITTDSSKTTMGKQNIIDNVKEIKENIQKGIYSEGRSYVVGAWANFSSLALGLGKQYEGVEALTIRDYQGDGISKGVYGGVASDLVQFRPMGNEDQTMNTAFKNLDVSAYAKYVSIATEIANSAIVEVKKHL